jgi:hypothetical protein
MIKAAGLSVNDLLSNGLLTIGVSLAIGLNGCQQKTAQSPAVPADQVAMSAQTDANGQPLPLPPNGQQFLQPTVPQLKPEQMPTLPIKGLTPATKPDSRLAQLGKLNAPINLRDPFSALGPSLPIVVPPVPTARPSVMPKVAAKAKPIAKSRKQAQTPRRRPQPTQIASQPRFAPMPAPIQMAPMPAPMPIAAMPAPEVVTAPIEAAPLPPISATSLADRVAITGVMQVGGKSMVIAKAENENSARYLQVGDSLAGGQVRVKSIRVSPMGEPIVVLEQNGVEVTKSVGDAGSRVATLR